MKFYGGVPSGKGNKWLNFGSDPDHHADSPIENPIITQQAMSGFCWNFQDSSAMTQLGQSRQQWRYSSLDYGTECMQCETSYVFCSSHGALVNKAKNDKVVSCTSQTCLAQCLAWVYNGDQYYALLRLYFFIAYGQAWGCSVSSYLVDPTFSIPSTVL